LDSVTAQSKLSIPLLLSG